MFRPWKCATASAAPTPTRGSSTSPTPWASSPAPCCQASHKALGLCNVAIGLQRRFAALPRTPTPAGRRPRPRGPQPPHLGDGGAPRAAPGARTSSPASSPTTATTVAADLRLPAPPPDRPGGRPLLLPPLLLRARRGRPGPADQTLQPPKSPHGTGPAHPLRRPRPRREARPPGPAGRGVLLRSRGGPRRRPPAQRGNPPPGGQHPQQRHAPFLPDDAVVEVRPPGSPRRARNPSPWPPINPLLAAASSPNIAAYEDLALEAALHERPAPASSAPSWPTPWIGQYEYADRLTDTLIAHNQEHLRVGLTAGVLAVDAGNSKTDVAVKIAPNRTVLATARGARASARPPTAWPQRSPPSPRPSPGRPRRRPARPAIDPRLAGLPGQRGPPRRGTAAHRGPRLPRLRRPPCTVRNDTFAVVPRRRPGTPGRRRRLQRGHQLRRDAPRRPHRRFPALGRISGDWGGGWALAEEALWHAARAQDGRGGPTALAPRPPGPLRPPRHARPRSRPCTCDRVPPRRRHETDPGPLRHGGRRRPHGPRDHRPPGRPRSSRWPRSPSPASASSTRKPPSSSAAASSRPTAPHLADGVRTLLADRAPKADAGSSPPPRSWARPSSASTTWRPRQRPTTACARTSGPDGTRTPRPGHRSRTRARTRQPPQAPVSGNRTDSPGVFVGRGWWGRAACRNVRRPRAKDQDRAKAGAECRSRQRYLPADG
ncbi:hypothetical protein SVIOM74S_09220 [Streptomyces violarus]